jgi:hypothetical protein
MIAPFGLFRCGVLGASTCARPRSTEPSVRFAHSYGSHTTNQNKNPLIGVHILVGDISALRAAVSARSPGVASSFAELYPWWAI